MRRDDFALFEKVIREIHPSILVELGTGEWCYLSFVLADIMQEIGGELWTFDKNTYGMEKTVDSPLSRLLALPNVRFFNEDILAPNVRVIEAVQAGAFVFCDNGHKQAEIENYAPYIPRGGVIGCHDYKSEVKPHIVEPYLEGLGFTPFHEPEAAILDGVWDYGSSRFWRRN